VYHLGGRKVALAGLRRIAGDPEAGIDDLRTPYRDWLSTRQPAVTIGSESTAHRAEFCDDPELWKLLSSHPATEVQPNINSDYGPMGLNEDNPQGRKAALEGTLDQLREIDPDLGGIFDLVVNRICVGGWSTGVAGSSSADIGVIWAAMPEGYDSGDLAEFLVHEFTHHLLFIDEAAFGHYTDPQAAATGGMSLSAIRGIVRPLAFVLHGLVVAVEILRLRRGPVGALPSTGYVHPDTQHLYDSSVACVRSIEASTEIRPLLSRRGQALFDSCRATLELTEMKRLGTLDATRS